MAVTCDICGQGPILGLRFRSRSRTDYDECELCRKSRLGPFTQITSLFYNDKMSRPSIGCVQQALHDGHR